MTWLIGFMLVSIGVGVGFLLCAVLTVGKFNDLENEIADLELEIDNLLAEKLS